MRESNRERVVKDELWEKVVENKQIKVEIINRFKKENIISLKFEYKGLRKILKV